jgi:hypothetical protein
VCFEIALSIRKISKLLVAILVRAIFNGKRRISATLSAIIAKLKDCQRQIPDAQNAGSGSRGNAAVRFLIGEIDKWLRLGGGATEYEHSQFMNVGFGNSFVSDSTFTNDEESYLEDSSVAKLVEK